MKTNNFFVIDNYNTIPDELIGYCEDYVIYDSSTDTNIIKSLENGCYNLKRIPRTGHNISSYFWFIEENYDNLPEVVAFVKGHIIGRHCSREYFNKVYDNKYFTPLFSPLGLAEKDLCLANFSYQIEQNKHKDEYICDRPQKYFMSKDEVLSFIYEQCPIPDFFSFAPGGCYIVRKEQILIHSKNFYHNVNMIMNYGADEKGNCPCEAHFIERILPMIFNSRVKTRDILDSCNIENHLLELEKNVEIKKANVNKKFKLLCKK